MKKLSVVDLVMIPMLVALTIVIKLLFKDIPSLEFTTAVFIGLSVLLKRHISIYYVVLFIIVDSLLILNMNLVFCLINAIVWLSIYGVCQLVKSIKWQQPIFVFVAGIVAVMLQTFLWTILLPLLSPGSAPAATMNMIIGMWIVDFASFHPLIAGGVATTIYFSLIGLNQAYRLNTLFDK